MSSQTTMVHLDDDDAVKYLVTTFSKEHGSSVNFFEVEVVINDVRVISFITTQERHLRELGVANVPERTHNVDYKMAFNL